MADQCCSERKMREMGFDGYDGHNPPVSIVKIKGRWCLNAQDWYCVDINHCPWCGTEMIHDSFGSGQVVEESGMSVEEMVAQIEQAMSTDTEDN